MKQNLINKLKLKILAIIIILSGSAIWSMSFVWKTDPVNEANALKKPGKAFYELYLNPVDTILDQEVLTLALNGYYRLRQNNKLENERYLTIIDYSRPSSQKRFFTIDLYDQNIQFASYVAHGKHSGSDHAREFSNRPGSHQSSLGFFITGNTYFGKHGYSLRLNGIEKGINHLAKERAIVIHGAKYVSKEYINKYGRLGRSYGCPAIPAELTKEIINQLKEGSCLFCYYPDPEYLTRSELSAPIVLVEDHVK